MTPELRPVPRPGWDPLPRSVGVVGRVLVREEDFFIAELRFAEHASVHEHPGERDTIVVCIEGEGFTSVGGVSAPLREEQQVRWPRDVPHRLWTEGTTMTTLMIEGAPVDFGS
jgi:quercetin dioxygenase-like cupin family protein